MKAAPYKRCHLASLVVSKNTRKQGTVEHDVPRNTASLKMTTLDGLTFSPKSWNDNSGWGAIFAQIMK
eukprot:3080396-Amphidinium_carterae.1